ncbi:hypothetical protein O1611_g1212 [Lasiodiplodia mahajangana]|uniref:Uncharacterized protein n=1 Tax=Lasiodiplodia mahajangana TaxID=1108764 RepID=A0ACC2JYR7_9PEZI|nr:hypothetical protein O1611_g1212 [Lasiodiplodia mahajangana]
MGTFCSVSKGSESGDNDDKGLEDSPSHNSRGMPSQQPKMTANNHKNGLRAQSPPREFKFQFQNDMAHSASNSANPNEAKAKEAAANDILSHMRTEDEAIYKGQPQSVLPSQHFVDVRDVLPQTRLFHVAAMVPKGAHLHLHFNSTLLPGVLLGYAKDMPNMYIWSDHQLLKDSDFKNCKLEFSLRNLEQVRADMRKSAVESQNFSMREKLQYAEGVSNEAEKNRAYDELGPNIFSSTYKHGRKDKNQQVEEMRYQYFRECWDEKTRGNCDEWLISKLTFSKEEVYSFFADVDDIDLEGESDTERKPTRVKAVQHTQVQPVLNGGTTQTFNEQDWVTSTRRKISSSKYKRDRISARKAWRAFNGRTKMMKGLFNYETAFRRYTRECLEEFVKDNVQYAEIRPNFMQTNQILYDDAQSKISNFGTMQLIIEEYEKFMKHIGDMREDGTVIDDEKHRPTFSGMKVIYCTPRSFNREAVRKALDECVLMKKKWPNYIAGFDLVGEEAFAKPHPLEYFEEDFQKFRRRCRDENIDIPFLFHCGETPDDLEGNLETALKLESKRIGHGYALPEKPHVLKEMRNKNVCVETCPISNMVLGLAESMDKHSMYRLLEENMHCAVSSDNGTLFNSTLSHDFYEVMAGHRKINLYGWKQLARWSIEHSCLSPEERRRMLTEWEMRWQDFVNALTETSSSGSQLASVAALERARERVAATRLSKLGNVKGYMNTSITGIP